LLNYLSDNIEIIKLI